MNGPFDPLPRHSFDLIMADPNWRFETWSDSGRGRKSPDHHYRTDTITEIKKWPILSLAHRNCVLWLWVRTP